MSSVPPRSASNTGARLPRPQKFFGKLKDAARFEALLPPLLFALVMGIFGPLRTAYELGIDEGYNLMKAALVAEGFSLYSDIWSDQPPLLTLILAFVHRLFPFSVEAARCISLYFSGLLIWSLFRCVHRLEGRMCAWLAVVALMVMPGFQALSTAVLVGVPAVALAMMALDQILAGASEDKTRRYWLAGLFFGLALQTKLFVLVLIPSLLLAIFVRLDDGGGVAAWRMRAPQLARFTIATTAAFLAVTILLMEPLFSQIIEPHYQAMLKMRQGGYAPLFARVSKHVPVIVLVLCVAGLALALRGMKATRLIPVVWLGVAVAIFGLHRPLWTHHLILLYPPIAWIAGLALQLIPQAIIRSLVMASCILLMAGPFVWKELAGTNPGALFRGKTAYGWPNAAALSQASADRWVLADHPIDAYRAGRLMPPELAVWSRKRLIGGKLTPEALVAVLETRRPQRLLLRRFKQPKPVLTAIASFYTELPFAAGPTTRNKPPQLYARADDPVPRDSSAGQTLLATTNALRKLSHSGGFAAHYNLRTGETWGEGRKAEPMDRDTIKVQPPGSTQEVGQCFLRAKRVTGATLFWEAAQEAGRALACAQRPDGGWASVAHLAAPCKARGEPRADRVATLDEGATQLAIAFLMDLAAVYATKPHPQPAWLDPSIRKGLDFLVRIQKKDGGWPQQHPKTKVAYAAYATLNDGVTSEAIAVLLRGHRILGDERYLDAAMRGGDFLIEVQGAPQAGWAQQYGPDNRPAAARSFEPAAYGSEESGFAINALIDLYVATGDERFLKGLDAARDWLERSAIRPGVWSRLYEVGTNRPIYGDRDGTVHYSLAELSEERRTGYRWEAAFPSVTRALGRYSALTAGGLDGLRRYEQEAERDKRRRLYAEATPLVEEIVSRAVPGQGWVENDILSTPAFITNCDVLLNSLEVAGSDAGQL